MPGIEEQSLQGSTTRNQWLDTLSAVLTGIIIGLVILITAISYGALIFSGPLGNYRAQGISIAIISTIISGIIFTAYSGARRILPVPDDDTLPILALALSLIAGAVTATGADSSSVFLTAVAAITLTTLACGIFFLLIGNFKLGRVVQYMPYSVIGGYFAGAGWLLLLGAIKVLLNVEIETFLDTAAAFTRENLSKLGFCLVVSLSIYGLGFRFPKGVAIPLAMLLTTLAFFALGLLAGRGPNQLLAEDWLIGPFAAGGGNLSATLALEALSGAHWQSIFSNSGSLLTIVVLSAISVLLTINGIDLLEENELDINHELKVAGRSCVLNGLFGGLISFHSFSVATLFNQLNAPATRVVNFSAIVLCVVGLLYGLSTIQYVPRPIIAGLLLYMAFAFLKEWLYEAWNKFPRYEYLVIPLILVSIISFGLIEGVAMGLVASIIIFVFKYSEVEVTRYSCSGKDLSSNVERGPTEERLLQEHGDSIYIVRLQGYLFFGTASRLYSNLVKRVNQDAPAVEAPLGYAIYDCSQISGVDSSAALSFIKMAKLASTRPFFFILANLRDEYRERLEQAGFSEDINEQVRFFASMDHAIEWCENRLLLEYRRDTGLSSGEGEGTILVQLSAIFPEQDLSDFLSYFSRQEVSAGYELCRQGGLSDEIYFIDAGECSVFIEAESGERHRIRRTTVGSVFGELGFYLGTPRTATVVADTDSEILTMDAKSLKRMEKDRPDLASIFHQWMVRVVTRRLLNTTRTLSAVIQ